MKARRAKCLVYLGSQQRPSGFRHFYRVDQYPFSFFTSVPEMGLAKESLRIAAAQAALANLIDLFSITLPREVIIEGIALSPNALEFWERTARNLAAERIAEDHLPASALDGKWRSTGSLAGHIKLSPSQNKRGRLLAMSGGKESLTALKMMGEKSTSLFFLHYPDNSWAHGKRLLAYFQPKHECLKVRTDIVNTGALTSRYGCNSYGLFVIGQIVLSALLLMDRFSSITIGNEYSANFGNGTYDGVPVNHQYDKSFSFSEQLNAYLAEHVTEEFTHDSPFWNWYEYRIAGTFFKDDRYLRQWTSCNNSTAANLFCGTCAKCAFVFILGAAHTDPKKIRRIMGRNMLEDIDLVRALADPASQKPLECVGTKEEVWVALEDIWQKQIWRNAAGLQFYANSVRPLVGHKLEFMRADLLRDQFWKTDA